jgi:hypothetical protein
MQFALDFLLILSAMPDPIRALLKQDWLGARSRPAVNIMSLAQRTLYVTCLDCDAGGHPCATLIPVPRSPSFQPWQVGCIQQAGKASLMCIAGTCGSDLTIAKSKIPCVENMVLVAALCIPIFLIIMFDTGILYQVGVFVYGCTNGLAMLGLGNIVTWNDLIKHFERGAEHCSSSLLTETAAKAWKQPDTVRAYYALLASRAGERNKDGESGSGGGSAARESQSVPKAQELDQLNAAQLNQYSKWTPFAEIWDVRTPSPTEQTWGLSGAVLAAASAGSLRGSRRLPASLPESGQVMLLACAPACPACPAHALTLRQRG